MSTSGAESVLAAADKIAANALAVEDIRQLCTELQYSAVSRKVLAIIERYGMS